MKKILIVFILVIAVGILVLFVLKSNSGLNLSHITLPISLKDTVYLAEQKDKKLYLDIYSKDSNLKRKIYFDHTNQDMTVPTMLCKINDEKLLIAVGNYDDNPIKIFMYNAKDGIIDKYGEILASNPNVIIAGSKLFSYRRGKPKAANYWIDEYELDNLKTKVKSIKIPDAPKKILFSENTNSLYFLFVGGTPVSSVGMYSINTGFLTIEALNGKYLAGDILVDKGKSYISMSHYSSDGKTYIADNRILVLGEKLKQERVIKTSKYPNLIFINGNDMYVTVGQQGVVVDKVDLKSYKLIKSFPLNDFGTPLATKFINSRLFILASDSLYTLDINGNSSKHILSGRTLSLW